MRWFFGLNHSIWYSLKESLKNFNSYYYLRIYSYFLCHAGRLCAYSPFAHRFFPCILYLCVGIFGIYGEVFRAVGELQDFFPRFLDLRRNSFRAFSTNVYKNIAAYSLRIICVSTNQYLLFEFGKT